MCVCVRERERETREREELVVAFNVLSTAQGYLGTNNTVIQVTLNALLMFSKCQITSSFNALEITCNTEDGWRDRLRGKSLFD